MTYDPIYANTPEMAAKIGWNLVPEYCLGDPSLPFVRHDIEFGVFVFIPNPFTFISSVKS